MKGEGGAKGGGLQGDRFVTGDSTEAVKIQPPVKPSHMCDLRVNLCGYIISVVPPPPPPAKCNSRYALESLVGIVLSQSHTSLLVVL